MKERIALSMIERAERDGKIGPQTRIIEPTSGNTGIGLAMVCAVKGYPLTLVMPESVSIERRSILKAFGAEVILTPAGLNAMQDSIVKAYGLAKELGDAYIPMQFENPANPEIHRLTTAMEIWEDMEGHVDVFVSGIGTGGTITGVGERLRQLNPNIYLIAVEPAESPMLSGGTPGKHGIQGIGAGFIPPILNTKIFSEIVTVSTHEAYQIARRLASEEGIFVGISSGAATAAALKYAQRVNRQEKIVVILPDTGERYLSTPLWQTS